MILFGEMGRNRYSTYLMTTIQMHMLYNANWYDDRERRMEIVNKKQEIYFKVLVHYFPGGTELRHENLSLDNRFLDCNSNPGPPEYEAGTLTSRLRLSVN
jgi:hypothetical protein